MAEDLATSLQSYQIQLQQVEAALTNDPTSDELLKLQKDLQEVITLTTDLLAASKGAPSVASSEGTSNNAAASSSSTHQWKPGDLCMAIWSDDGQYYEAEIEDITEGGQCTVNFPTYGNTDIAMVDELKPLEASGSEFPEGMSKSKKQLIQAQREAKKKKAQKKAQRMKQIEEEREKEKVKWHSFNSKAFNKNKKGHVKKSIFASPDNINGRVGVGTCGIGGRPMTEYHQQEKWRRPMQPPQPHRFE